MDYSVSYLLIWTLICVVSLPRTEMMPLELMATRLFTPDISTVDFLTQYDTPCDGCCDTRVHGHVIVLAEVIQNDFSSSSFQPSLSTFLPFSSTAKSSELPPQSSSTTPGQTTPVTGLSSSPKVPLTTASSNTSTSTVSSTSTSSLSTSTTAQTNGSSSTSSTKSKASTNSSTPSPPISTLAPKNSSSTVVSSPSTPYPSSLFPSSFGPSSTTPEPTCGIGEICCETRMIGHLVVMATIVHEPNNDQCPNENGHNYTIQFPF